MGLVCSGEFEDGSHSKVTKSIKEKGFSEERWRCCRCLCRRLSCGEERQM